MNMNLREQLKQLRLSGLLQTLEVRLQEAKSSKLDYAEFLELILEDEMVVRSDRQIERRTKAAAFRDQKCLDDFDFDFNKSVKRKQIYDLAAGDFVRKHHDAIFVGPPGVGKSHIVQSIGRQLIRDGYTVYYRSIFDCVRDFLHDEAFEGHDRILNRYLKPDVLILDDMGMKQLPKKSGEFLFEIIMRRHELRSTMMTSNRPLEDWGKLIGDVPSATAILDRFLQSAEVIQITGRSFRLRGHRADKKTDQAAVDEAETEPENELKTGQSKTGHKRPPGRPKKTTKKPAN
ncbi:IS21-like element helper ATPase IstB [Stieleria magnilauensis]|uniref:DNA replication protein DnaC n=1 Tax=Stieleria magnilauensis TaxID=2527963 RepID=A0ABX5XTQ5_9BACT|nr:DNA replication protein DnaC [Planctomycetes bacterium TBK1r]